MFVLRFCRVVFVSVRAKICLVALTQRFLSNDNVVQCLFGDYAGRFKAVFAPKFFRLRVAANPAEPHAIEAVVFKRRADFGNNSAAYAVVLDGFFRHKKADERRFVVWIAQD